MKDFDLGRYIVETAVSKALRDMQRDPDRSLRNIVDLGEKFSTGRRQKGFLRVVQSALEREDSPYYLTAKHAASHVQHDRLRTFGMNLGYNGLTRGARIIRELEAAGGVNIPWTITMEYAREDSFTTEDICRVIEEAMEMGIYTYMLFAGEEAATDLLPLFERYAECAFFLFIDVKSAHAGWLDAIDRYANVMPVLGGETGACEEAADTLLEKKCLYSAYLTCTDENIAAMEMGGWMDALTGSGYIFTFLITLPGTSGSAHTRVTSLVGRARGEQWSPLILIDFLPDIEAIDAAISNEPCFLGINSKGFVYVRNPRRLTDVSVRDLPMREIIDRLMPRTGTVQPAPLV